MLVGTQKKAGGPQACGANREMGEGQAGGGGVSPLLT